MQTLFTIDEFRAMQTAKKASSKVSSYDDRYDFTFPDVSVTMGCKIVGIDPDTSGCGVAMYDSDLGTVPFYEEVEPSRILDCIRDLLADFGSTGIIYRLEVPTMSTIYGANEGLKRGLSKVSKKAREMKLFRHIFDSARCSEIANQIIADFNRAHVAYNLIPSNNRINFKNGKESQLKDKDFMAYMRGLFLQRVKYCYPSKLSSAQLKMLFPAITVAGSEDKRDALTLASPEAVYRKLKNK